VVVTAAHSHRASIPPLLQGACDGWRAVREWRRSDDGCLNLARLQELAGHCVVTVTDTAQCVASCAVLLRAWHWLGAPLLCAERAQAPQWQRALPHHDLS
jgi:uncharacterized protein YjiS (DUF1127 family)